MRSGIRVFMTLNAACCALAAPVRAQTLMWSDEFNGSSIDLANWEHMIGNGCEYGICGWGNNELEYYTDRPENSYVADGSFHIVARAESYQGFSYTSARLRSLNRQDFLYGRFEARIKLPSGGGMWPAFWMLPTNSPYGGWAASGEIDIMESVNEANSIHGTIHYGGVWPNNVSAGNGYADGTDFSDDFHVYRIDWEPDEMRWYVDGIWYHTATSGVWYSEAAPGNNRAPFDQYFHLLLNVAVGGNWPGCTSPGCITATFPQEMLIDWVRVYDIRPFNGDPQAIPGLIEAEDFDLDGEGNAYHDCDVTNNGGSYRPADGVDIEISAEGGFNVGWMCPDEWLDYTVEVVTSGTYAVEARVASLADGGTFHLEFDGIDVTGDVQVPVTGGWQTWTTVTTAANLAAGVQEMRFVNGSASGEYNLNYFNWTLTHLPADFDADNDVDGQDFTALQTCLSGQAVPVPPGCEDRDLDRDRDVDQVDFGIFQRCLSGENVAPDPTCAD